VGVAQVDTATTVLGIPVSLPVLLAPVAYQRMAHPEGEVATARAAAAAGTLLVVSTIATASIEEVARVAPDAPRWFQLYMAPEREISEHLIARAEAAGYRALCLTVDTPLLGRRERDVRNRFNPGIALANFEGDIARMPRTQTGSSFAVGASRLLDASLTWDTVRWMRGRTRLPIIVKGVIAAADVEPAIEAGVSAIVVSNHGGRQLDGCEPHSPRFERGEAAAERVRSASWEARNRRGEARARRPRRLVRRPIVWGLAAGRKGVAGARAAVARDGHGALRCPTMARFVAAGHRPLAALAGRFNALDPSRARRTLEGCARDLDPNAPPASSTPSCRSTCWPSGPALPPYGCKRTEDGVRGDERLARVDPVFWHAHRRLSRPPPIR
jgi:hypothetical protein